MKQLPYEEWLACIGDEIKLLLPKDVDYDVQISPTINHDGVTEDSVIIRKNQESIAPILYLKPYYLYQIKHQCSLTAIAQVIVNDYHYEIQNQDLNQIRQNLSFNWDSVKDKVFLCLVNMERNMNMLENAPYEMFGDMALVAKIKMYEVPDSLGTVFVNNQVLAYLGIDKDTLFQNAKENTPKLFPPKIRTMEEVIKNLTQESLEEAGITEESKIIAEMPMYIISNTYGTNGATVITYPGMEERLKDLLGGDFILLPSSTHEFMAIKRSDMPVKDAVEMVREVNATVVETPDFLSDAVYTLENGKCINLIEMENARSGEAESSLDVDTDLEM